MTLANDLKRPAAKRIAHAITVLTTPIWLGPVALAGVGIMIGLVGGLIANATEWLMQRVLRSIDKVKWAAFDAYVKRWPTKPQTFDEWYINEAKACTTSTYIARSEKYICGYCRCLWRKWPTAGNPNVGWSLWDGAQKPCHLCDNSPSFLSVVTKVST